MLRSNIEGVALPSFGVIRPAEKWIMVALGHPRPESPVRALPEASPSALWNQDPISPYQFGDSLGHALHRDF